MAESGAGVDLVIVGAGGHGSELRSYLLDMPAEARPNLLGFIDDVRAKGPFFATEVLGAVSALPALMAPRNAPLAYVTAFGSNELRRRIVTNLEALKLSRLTAYTLRHVSSQTGYEVELGEGTLLAPNVVVTTRVSIGRHCILNVRASVSHDCRIGDFVNINPAATLCGNVTVGDGSFVGAGAVVREKVTIGRDVVVGAGAVVVHDLPDGVTAVGVPARIVTRRTDRGQ